MYLYLDKIKKKNERSANVSTCLQCNKTYSEISGLRKHER